jgi:hypothetical protein
MTTSPENAVAMAELQAMINKIIELPDLGKKAAPNVAKVVRRDIEGTIARGTTSEGNPWKRTEHGDKPLKNAAQALRVASISDVIYARIVGVEARHHKGAVKGGVKRSILPARNNDIPARMAALIRRVLEEEFLEAIS